ncbi:hypothetical protein HER10_EVM0009180 [Colletotrichum scovillei]|uniref:Uncharacterized protein n=1 Tax=Colletotrichum scovillei TaxID=1209932 RepID=A0A9P7R0W6_9PEZI|nr:uncharacterized protein HER10_EVM0009180 [Colletotrichum scovillei]KAF4776821.1 hypothetical protein HER10_EVM0009180 [Colletotrichum scovillei]KAG7047537.1 hypothetical protein JMJ77_0010886 [Colletotrichum scovillei]KAG7059855.1 hypothetical protein JMJ78_0015141 [Colletotrichum scovillei]KAG7067302.1 hypothetical protein JMJ76_0008742 [Colletotrichum scovillei]
MESISNIVNKSAVETATTTTAAITSPSAPASTTSLQQRIAKRRREWTLTLTDGPVSSPGPKAKYRRSRSWSTRIGVDAPLNAERQIPVLYAIAMSKSKSNIPSSPTTSSTSSSSSSSAIEGFVNDEYPPDAEEYRICPDTDSPRYKHESDVGLWSGPRSSPGPRARYARSRSWSSRQSDSGYSSGADCVVSESESDDGCAHYTFLSGADYFDSESGSKCSKGEDDIAMTDVPLIGVSGYGDIVMADISPMEFPGDGDVVMVDASPIGASGDDDVIMAEYEDDDEDISMADYGGDDDVSMADYVEDDDIEMSDYSEDVDVEMADYGDSDVEMFDHIEDTRTNVLDYRDVVEIDSFSESGDSLDDSLIVYNSEYEDDSEDDFEDFELAMGYYSDGDSSSDGGDYPDPEIALADDNDAAVVTTWPLDGTTLIRNSPNGSGRYSSPALSDRPEPDLISEYTLTRWVNGVAERMIYVDFDYSDLECDEELPVVELRLPEDEKDHYE